MKSARRLCRQTHWGILAVLLVSYFLIGRPINRMENINMTTNCIVIKMQAATLKKIECNGKFILFFNEQLAVIETGEDFVRLFKLMFKDG
jgi:hypothetical protein